MRRLPCALRALAAAFTVYGLLAEFSAADLAGMQRIGTFSAPIFMTHAPNDTSRLFVVERGGAIKIYNTANGTVNATPFLSIPGVDQGGEGGLLGMAFHPDYAANGKFYVYATFDNGGINIGGATSPFSSHIREYTVSANPNVANTTFNPVLNWVQPQDNHNGGWIGFSPNDGYLYIASGDGGNFNDTGAGHDATAGNAQDTTSNLLGKMLRIDVDGDDFTGDSTKNYAIPPNNPFVGTTGDDEIWAYGLRNPFRNSFDRQTGDLWIGDVGQDSREEVDFQSAASAGGQNYGWRFREGFIQTPSVGGAKPTGNVDPVYDYSHGSGSLQGIAVTGGYRYRGPDPALQGLYFFGDSGNSTAGTRRIWTFDPANPAGTVLNRNSVLAPNVGTAIRLASFGEDAFGNLYAAFIQTGEVYRLGTNQGDFDGDGNVDADDLARWVTGYTTSGSGRANGDADADGDVDGNDFLVWQRSVGNAGFTAIPPTVGSSTGVPEPAGALLLLSAAVLLAGRRRIAG